MFHIAICDSSTKSMKYLTCTIYSLPKAMDSIEVHPFTEAEKLLEKCKNGTRYGLITLVSQEGPDEELETARNIRQYDPDVPLYLISPFSEKALEGIGILTKYYKTPLASKEFLTDVHALMKNKHFSQDYIIKIHNNSGIHNVVMKDILYVESYDGSLRVVTSRGDISCRGSILFLDKMITRHGFFRSHKSYFLNMHKIQDVLGRTVVMQNGHTIPLAKRQSARLRACLWHLESNDLILKL